MSPCLWDKEPYLPEFELVISYEETRVPNHTLDYESIILQNLL